MEEYLERVKRAKAGEIVTIVKTLSTPINATEFFCKLSDYGRKKYSLFFESADIVPKYGELSLGSASPCLKVSGKGPSFEIQSLNQVGFSFLKAIKKDLSFCDKLVHKKNTLYGTLSPKRKNVSEDERLRLKTHLDILRVIAGKFKPTSKPFIPYCGLFGAIGYDFIDQFEDLPKNEHDILQAPDYEMYYLNNLFITDHKKGETSIIVNILITEGSREQLYQNALRTIQLYEKTLEKKLAKPKPFKEKKQEIATSTSKAEFENTVATLKNHILRGDIFQVVPSRTVIADYNAEPISIYEHLKKINPSPYMFYVAMDQGILLGASPEMAIRVQGEEKKTVEIRPIAGTKPRGIIGGTVNEDLDSRYETELKIDRKELAEHTMLIDLARNDVAKVSETGTRYCNEPFVVEKYSHVQHLVSNVKGILKEGFDALHAYLATMNMGTLTGCPKVEAMKLLRIHEKERRGFYGGSVGYITPSGDLDAAIIIRSMFLKGGKAHIRSGAGIVFDSMPEQEFFETEKKAKACLVAIKNAGGFK
ncbi:anthranilate synthase component 1 [Candidatus Woesearchaeota archaeon]|nr:anthranilate synthase component 1 [Candidatus Woesearchaeota archaeon]